MAHDYRLFHPYFKYIERAVDHIIPIETEFHDIEQNLNLIRFFGVADIPFEKYPQFKFFDDAYLEADAFLSANRISETANRLFMHPGCNRGAEHKRWPVQHFVELGCALREKYDVEIFVILGPDESEYREFFDRPEFHIVESMSYAAILALLSTADLLVSNDSGIMHSAALLQIPVVTIWGGTDERRNGARGTVAVNIKNMAIECRPCARFVTTLNCPDIKFECIRSISVKTVYDSIEENRFFSDQLQSTL